MAVIAAAGLRMYQRLLAGARRERDGLLGIERVRVAALGGHVGRNVRFRHPTRPREVVAGRLVSAQESALSLAWVRVHVDTPDGRSTAYELAGRDWAEVTNP